MTASAEFTTQLSALDSVNESFFKQKSISSLEHALQRENALIGSIMAMAKICGVELKPIHRIDARGELSIVVKPTGPNQGWGSCGMYGEQFASWLSQIPHRTGTAPCKGEVLPENGWCYINHFDAEGLVQNFAKRSGLELAQVEPNTPVARPRP